MGEIHTLFGKLKRVGATGNPIEREILISDGVLKQVQEPMNRSQMKLSMIMFVAI